MTTAPRYHNLVEPSNIVESIGLDLPLGIVGSYDLVWLVSDLRESSFFTKFEKSLFFKVIVTVCVCL